MRGLPVLLLAGMLLVSGLLSSPQASFVIVRRVSCTVDGDSLSGLSVLQGFYSWSVSVDSPEALNGSLTLNSSVRGELLRFSSEAVSWMCGGYCYSWFLDNISSFSLVVNLTVRSSFIPFFKARVTVSPEVIVEERKLQTATITITPVREVSSFTVTLESLSWSTPEVDAEVVAGGENPSFTFYDRESAGWTVNHPTVGREYSFSFSIQVSNKVYPTPVYFRPEIVVSGREEYTFGPGATVNAADDKIGLFTLNLTNATAAGTYVKIEDIRFTVKSFAWGEIAPQCRILSITPDRVRVGENVSFVGYAVDLDGSIVGYEWTSSIDGFLSSECNFTTASLSPGTHVISFRAQDNMGLWSPPSTAVLTVEPQATGSLIVTVRDKQGLPVSNAEVYVDSAFAGVTGGDGVFYTENIPAGSYNITVLKGTAKAVYLVDVKEGINKVEVTLEVSGEVPSIMLGSPSPSSILNLKVGETGSVLIPVYNVGSADAWNLSYKIEVLSGNSEAVEIKVVGSEPSYIPAGGKRDLVLQLTLLRNEEVQLKLYVYWMGSLLQEQALEVKPTLEKPEISWPDVAEATVAVVTTLAAAFAWVSSRGKRERFKNLMIKVDSAYQQYKDNPQLCIGEMYRLKQEALQMFRNGKIDESSYETIDSKIEGYIAQLKGAIK